MVVNKIKGNNYDQVKVHKKILNFEHLSVIFTILFSVYLQIAYLSILVTVIFHFSMRFFVVLEYDIPCLIFHDFSSSQTACFLIHQKTTNKIIIIHISTLGKLLET